MTQPSRHSSRGATPRRCQSLHDHLAPAQLVAEVARRLVERVDDAAAVASRRPAEPPTINGLPVTTPGTLLPWVIE